MQRRQFLILFSRSVYLACGATVAGAIGRYLGAPLVAGGTSGKTHRTRVATLDSLPVGAPTLLSVEGVRRDAWVTQPSESIGNIWITRISSAETPPAKSELLVFNAACPHNGCPLQKAAQQGFACHCHGARFDAEGEPAPDTAEFTNPSPRGMDPLEYAIVQDDESGQWWVEVVFQSFETGLSERVAES